MNRGNGTLAVIGIVIGFVLGLLMQDILYIVVAIFAGGIIGWLLDFVLYLISGNAGIDQRMIQVTRR